jgi:hypothetical protein
VAVFGRDDRVALPTRLMALKEKIAPGVHGLLRGGKRRGDRGPLPLATHGEPAPPLADFWFARNFEGKRHFKRVAGSGRSAAAQHVMSGSMDPQCAPADRRQQGLGLGAPIAPGL